MINILSQTILEDKIAVVAIVDLGKGTLVGEYDLPLDTTDIEEAIMVMVNG